MVAPIVILAGASVGLSLVRAIAGAPANLENISYQKGMMAENQRYWDDYKKNTGYSPRYPYRSGANYNQSSLLGSYGSLVGGATGVGGTFTGELKRFY